MSGGVHIRIVLVPPMTVCDSSYLLSPVTTAGDHSVDTDHCSGAQLITALRIIIVTSVTALIFMYLQAIL